jgi:hypothetical protein
MIIFSSKAGVYPSGLPFQVLLSPVGYWPCPQILYLASRYNYSSLFVQSVSDEEKKFYNTEFWPQCYKTFFFRNLQIS